MSNDQQEELTYEGQRLLRIRKQMREQDKKRFRHPDADTPQISIAYVWRENAWIPITWMRGTVTPHKIQWMRKRYCRKRSRATRGRIGRREVLRLVELRIARSLGGAGGAPLGASLGRIGKKPDPGAIPGISVRRRAERGTREGVNLGTSHRSRRGRISRTGGKLSGCDFVQHGTRCKHRAFWFVGYMDDKKPFGKKRVVKKRCTKHAWKDKYFPATARQVVCIQRKPKKVAA